MSADLRPPVRPVQRVPYVDAWPFAVAVVAGSIIVTGLSGRAPWWVGVAVQTALLAAAAVPVAGRPPSAWAGAWIRYRYGLAARARTRAVNHPVAEVGLSAGICGIRRSGTIYVAMLQLSPNLDLPTVLAEATRYTEDTVPIGVLAGMLDHYDINIDIDIVTTARRVGWSSSYGLLYEQLTGSRSGLGARSTWLVLRLDAQRNLAGLARRGPAEVAAPKALAAAAIRVAARLRQRGVVAHALPAGLLRQATRLLHAGAEPSDLRETWRHLLSPIPGRQVTCYWIDAARLDQALLERCWAVDSDFTTVVLSLSRPRYQAGAPEAGTDIELRALVRYVGPGVQLPQGRVLRMLGGRQSVALLASLARETTLQELGPGAPLNAELLGRLRPPIGSTGQVLGSVSGRPQHAMALALFDPSDYHPQRRTVEVQAELAVVAQIVLRAAAVGAEVEIHSARPERWRRLVAEVGDERSLRLAPEAGVGMMPEPATVAVFDLLPPVELGARTTLTVREPSDRRSSTADIAIRQVDRATVDVAIPMHTVRVDLIELAGETRYFEATSPVQAPTTQPAPTPLAELAPAQPPPVQPADGAPHTVFVDSYDQ